MMWLEMMTTRGKVISVNPATVAAVQDAGAYSGAPRHDSPNGAYTILCLTGGGDLMVMGKRCDIAKAIQNELGHRSRKL